MKRCAIDFDAWKDQRLLIDSLQNESLRNEKAVAPPTKFIALASSSSFQKFISCEAHTHVAP